MGGKATSQIGQHHWMWQGQYSIRRRLQSDEDADIAGGLHLTWSEAANLHRPPSSYAQHY